MYTSTMQTTKLKTLIQSKLKELQALQVQAEAGCDTVILDQACVGRLSRMDAMQSQAMNQEAQRRRKTEIRRLDVALKNMAEGDYGYCEACGEEIAHGRLMLDPAAAFCIACAQANESK
jgi:DnaK suppressor protein